MHQTPKQQLLAKANLLLYNAIDTFYHGTVWNKQRTQEERLHIGEYYITQRQIDEIKIQVGNIAEACLCGIQGELPSYWEEWEDPKDYCPYKAIQNTLTDNRTGWLVMDLSREIRQWIQFMESFDARLSTLLPALMPNVKPHKQVRGKMVEMTESEIVNNDINRKLNLMELVTTEEHWSADMLAIQKIVKEKGNLGKILELL